MGTIGKVISGLVGFVRAIRAVDDPNESLDSTDVAIADQVQRELDAAPPGIRRYLADRVHPPYNSGSPEAVRALVRQQEAFCKEVQRELDALPPDIRHLVEVRMFAPYHPESVEIVRTLARQYSGSM